MKFLPTALLVIALLVSTASSHSWCECVDDASNHDELKANPTTANLAPKCNGYPRNKVNNGDWIKESTYYLWDLSGDKASNEQGGRHACHPTQRDPTYPDNVPAAKAKAGQSLRLRFWGNGHASYQWGRPLHKDPGLVRVYWAGTVNKEIVMASELTPDKMIAEGNFSADAVTVPKDGNLPNDKANWMQLNLPVNMPQGRNMFVWTWAPIWDSIRGDWINQYATCFDIFVNGKVEGDNPSPPPSEVKPVDKSPKIKENCEKQCLRGGQSQFPCSGDSCPPCRYNGSCFDYDSSGKCPNWAGGFDCKKGQPI
ncbi:hypothetical protein L211DRAFT_775535 [Terfezia boudieri ATCC MYA-4762]|uniref:DUF7492 domain-containing protein n=1 Tax=Terfezia boudieri ATCC MYA-4762 TaxID=1051890 RepID=A0A3N4MQ17_9PEZI|nr:hypothetical protein L211DRAFT_775535 [Terfezia boudieri ATCC MYA-4762]